MSKTNRTQTDDKLNEFTDHFAQLHNHVCLNKMEMELKDIVQRTMQPPMCTNVEHNEVIWQSGNIKKRKQEHN